MSKFLRIPFAGYAALAATSVGAVAADRVALPYVQPTSGWIVSIGGTARLGPEYLGSSKFGFSGSPSLSFRRQGETPAFSAPEDGLDYALLQTQSFSFGPVAKFQSGRYSGSDNKLFGLRDVPWTVEAGAFVEFWPITDRLRTRLEIRQGFHGHHGLIADASADWVERIGAFTLSGGPRLSLANGSYMDRNFGISPVEAAINGVVTPFRAKGGLKSVGADAALDYQWSRVWTTRTFVKYERLVGSADNSPIVRAIGERNQFTFGVGATYSFAWGG
ncbi:MipA/OmpV family protein [Bosea caraganae]|uniref:MipA/OmpV family protein n=1 Tax=Bosea caraganae TaxID=2763117 RepID=UPI0015F00EA0|nr:MipA/OmpV family protein [Bosea caraganae]